MKKLFILILVLQSSLAGLSQIIGGGDVNGELRPVLGSLAPPPVKSPFLYDLVGHMTEERWFVSNNFIDTNNSINWYNVYDEMKYSAVEFLPLSGHKS